MQRRGATRALWHGSLPYYYRRIWPENWVDGGGLGITIRNEPRETVLTSIAISGGGVGNAAPYVKFGPKILIVLHGQISSFLDRVNFSSVHIYLCPHVLIVIPIHTG